MIIRYSIVLLGLLFALLTGLLLGAGQSIVAVGTWALPIGLGMILFPRYVYWGLLAIVLLINGLVQFFADFGQLQWVASGMGVTLMLSGLFFLHKNPEQVRVNPIDYFLIIFVLCAICSTSIGGTPPAHLAVGLRTYLPFLGFYMFVRSGVIDAVGLRKTLMFLIFVALVQWPIEVYQALVVVPERMAKGYFGSAWDSIVGSFGGPKFGGGASGSLAVYLVASLIWLAAFYREKHLKTGMLALYGLFIMIGIGLAETKVVFVLIPVGMLVLYADYVIKSPAKFAIGSLISVFILTALLYVYFVFFWESETRGDIWAALERRFAYSFDPTFMPATDWPGRFTGLNIWYSAQDFIGDPFHWMLGYGLAAASSFSTIAGPGIAAQKFGLGTDVSGATKLLWEVGLLGLVAFLMAYAYAMYLAKTLSSKLEIPDFHRAALLGISAIIPILIFVVPYEVTIVSSPPLQLLGFFILAYVSYWYNSTSQRTG